MIWPGSLRFSRGKGMLSSEKNRGLYRNLPLGYHGNHAGISRSLRHTFYVCGD
jgi:hypothetical protein